MPDFRHDRLKKMLELYKKAYEKKEHGETERSEKPRGKSKRATETVK